MKGVRKILFWCHLTAGSVVGIVILTMCATGILLASQPLVLALVERPARQPDARAAASPLGPGTLLRLGAAASPGGAPTAVTIPADPSEPATVAFGRESAVFLDRSTGTVVCRSAPAWRAFFSKVQDLHRWLAVSAEHRDAGRAVTGAANVAFLGLALSGLFIWWPRLRGIRRVASVGLFARGLKGKARDFNWHNTLGVWCAGVIAVITVTALPMSYRWANDLVYRVAGGSPQPAPAGGEARARGERASRDARPLSEADAARLDRLWPAAERRSPGWKAITMRAPAGRSAPVAFTIEEGRFRNRFARSSLALDPASGAVVQWEPYAEASAGRRTRSWMRFLHTGEALGVPGQIAAAASSFGSVLLAITGISLALRRLASWRARRRDAIPESSSKEIELARAKGAMS
ncbi:MAG TPA: PepSY-associated TM helix domain-containing protein [Thermoanaerobaculia bacterium]|nr:PepSY-associated TM helix domain-containing protein [Thermoanaerobaculia bacterium]